MRNDIGNYTKHAQIWDWGGYERIEEFEYWCKYAKQFGDHVLIPFCALGETGAYMARKGFTVTAFDITPEMIEEGKKRFSNVDGLKLFIGDVTDFYFDIAKADFCFASDFGHIHTLEDIKKALSCINHHLREGGVLVIETGLPYKKSNYYPPKAFYPKEQVYPDKKVWKIGDTLNDAETGRCYISQTVFIEDMNGRMEQFEHSFYLQSHSRNNWLSALLDCGYGVQNEYSNREKEPWIVGDGYWIVEAIKKEGVKR